MGIPYSKQINAAFDQVTPLVQAGFEVLETTKNIAVLLAYIQVLTVVILFLILLCMLGLLITTNPDLEHERQVLITPIVKWLATRVVKRIEFASAHRYWTTAGAFVFVVFGALLYLGAVATQKVPEMTQGEEGEGQDGQGDRDAVGGNADAGEDEQAE